MKIIDGPLIETALDTAGDYLSEIIFEAVVSRTLNPVSRSLIIPRIWASVNLDFFMMCEFKR